MPPIFWTHTSADAGGGRSNERFRLTESVLEVDHCDTLLWLGFRA